MYIMMYKHWKKILLAMTSFFRGACNAASDNSAATVKVTKKIAAKEVVGQKTVKKDTLKAIKDTSNLATIVPIYGINVPDPTLPPQPKIQKIPCGQQKGNFIVKCLNDMVCVDDSAYPGCKNKSGVAAKYGTITPKKNYICDNGKTYTDAEFTALYTIVNLPSKIVKE